MQPAAPQTRRPYIDLHLHSYYSDGSDAPAEIVRRAAALGIAALSLTDHDTTAGLEEMRGAAEEAGTGFVNGVEVSCRHAGLDLGLHILGYGFDPCHAALSELIQGLARGRADRVRQILQKLADAGIVLPLLQHPDAEDAGALTRMHVARALHEAGHVRTVQRAFDQFLNPGGIAWTPQAAAPIEEAIEAIHAAGGVAAIAHPCLTKRLSKSLDELLKLPFDGIEVYHSSHTRADTQRLRILAHERGLLPLGGSDCHGMVKGKREMGGVKTPFSCWEALQERLAKRQAPGRGDTPGEGAPGI
jgi:predicted metal-dependent phosphoesterase TrpH